MVIVNPAAGGGRGRERFERLRPRLPWPAFEVQVRYSESPGHATALAREAMAAGVETVVAVGGDGTVSEVAPPLMGTEAQLAVVPTGTGCDLIRSLGIPARPEQALAALPHYRPRPLDMGRLGDRHFVNAAGLGFDAEVAREVNALKASTSASGTWPYLLGLSRVLRRYQGPEVSVEGDCTAQGPVLLITLANGRYYGGGMRISPSSDPGDGQLEMVRVEALRPAGVVMLLPGVFRGRHIRHPAVHVDSFRSITLVCDRPTLVHCDGELWRTLAPGERLEVSVVPHALNLLAPPPPTPDA